MNPVTYEEAGFDSAMLTSKGITYKGEFSSLRVTNHPFKFKYELRHGDDDSYPCTIENSVRVNFFGTFLTNEEIPLKYGVALIDVDPSDGYSSFGFTS